MSNSLYYNSNGEAITQQQIELISVYEERNYVNNVLKTKIWNSSSKAVRGWYFLATGENLNDILNQVIQPSGASWMIFHDKTQSGNYNQWLFTSYDKNAQPYRKGLIVFDEKQRSILSITQDLTTGVVIEKSRKTYYANKSDNELADVLLEFSYNIDGSFSSVYDVNGNWGYEWKTLDFDQYQQSTISADFVWEDHPYYHAATPYFPEGNL